jgi:RimJ/RimL family protein N-acetyltransferase
MIETKRLQIRPLSLSELKKHVEKPAELANDLGLKPSLALIDNETKEAIINDLLPFIAQADKNALFYTMWIIVEKAQKAIIGGICFHGEPDNNGEVEIGYGIDPAFQNLGYMTETIEALVHWLKDNKLAKLIKAETEANNQASAKVLVRNGFTISSESEGLHVFRLAL